MSPYEIAQVIIASLMVVLAVIGAGLGLRQLGVANRQLTELADAGRHSIRANQNANIMAVVALEAAVADARERVASAATRVAGLATSTEPTMVELVGALYDEAVEQYLNATDRLCSCIIRGVVDECVYRRDYQAWVAEIVKKHEKHLGAATRHANILRVHEAWRDDRKALDPSIPTPS